MATQRNGAEIHGAPRVSQTRGRERGGATTYIGAERRHHCPGGNLECMLSTFMLGHHRTFMTHVVALDQQAPSYDMRDECKVIEAMSRPSGVTDPVVPRTTGS